MKPHPPVSFHDNMPQYVPETRHRPLPRVNGMNRNTASENAGRIFSRRFFLLLSAIYRIPSIYGGSFSTDGFLIY